MVLMALRLVRPDQAGELGELFQRAARLAIEFPCADGGWAAFDKGSHAALARGYAVRGSQRDSRSNLQRFDGADA